MKVTGFRRDVDDFFNNLSHGSANAKQTTPFIVVSGKDVTEVEYTWELLKMHPTAKVFQTWVGQYSSNVFHFTVKQLRAWIKEHPEVHDRMKL